MFIPLFEDTLLGSVGDGDFDLRATVTPVGTKPMASPELVRRDTQFPGWAQHNLLELRGTRQLRLLPYTRGLLKQISGTTQ